MYGLVIGLIIFFAVLLVLVILAQNSKGGGLTSQFGGSAASNLIGVKKTGDLLEKLTWGFIIAIIALSLSTNFLVPSTGGSTNEIFDKATQQAPPNLNMPAPVESETDSAE
jgi:preprotein translocase subunit SecG